MFFFNLVQRLYHPAPASSYDRVSSLSPGIHFPGFRKEIKVSVNFPLFRQSRHFFKEKQKNKPITRKQIVCECNTMPCQRFSVPTCWLVHSWFCCRRLTLLWTLTFTVTFSDGTAVCPKSRKISRTILHTLLNSGPGGQSESESGKTIISSPEAETC